jgi:SAM-dependent methyltransferase
MRDDREASFWDAHVPDVETCLEAYARDPSPSLRLAIDAIAPLAGRHVVDFACGAGILSAQLAAAGAAVTGVDVSGASLRRGRELADRLGLRAEFTDSLQSLAARSWDAVIGQYALHHVDIPAVAPELRRLLKPGGVGAFVETIGLNPVLNAARRHLTGRGPVRRYGTDDERPLTRADLRALRAVFDDVSLRTAEMRCFTIFDRNVLRYRHPRASAALGALDRGMGAVGLDRLSYHQVVIVRAASG